MEDCLRIKSAVDVGPCKSGTALSLQHQIMLAKALTPLACAVSLLPILVAQAQELLADTGVAGPEIEVVHFYHGQWPTGELARAEESVFSINLF